MVEIRRTLDGSDTLFVPELNAHYHSTFGAVQEARHIFIEQGFLAVDTGIDPVCIFEVGFGTGLNALLTDLIARALKRKVRYSAIEKYPLKEPVWKRLNYPTFLPEPDAMKKFRKIHNVPWDLPCQISHECQLTKIHADLLTFIFPTPTFHVIYFDPFAPDVQPDLWTPEIFAVMFRLLQPGGFLVTYSCKGEVQRNLKGAGFNPEKLPGPPGKRNILRAWKS